MNGFSPSGSSLRRVMGAGTLGFGILGVASPRTLGRMLAVDDETARAIGFRDIGSGFALLRGGRAALVQRIVFDLSDARLLAGRRKPAAAALALGFAALCAYALASE